MKKEHKIIIIALFAIFIAILIFGLIRGDFLTTFFNGRTLCLSCIGIGSVDLKKNEKQ